MTVIHMNARNRTRPANYLDAEKALHELGYLHGAPGFITEGTRRVDELMCIKSRCPSCRGHGLAYRPFHTRDGRYKVLGECLVCGGVIEV